ncbi:MAG: hypothetical protein V4492_05120, partial [Chlamydiota bacterium]
ALAAAHAQRAHAENHIVHLQTRINAFNLERMDLARREAQLATDQALLATRDATLTTEMTILREQLAQAHHDLDAFDLTHDARDAS